MKWKEVSLPRSRCPLNRCRIICQEYDLYVICCLCGKFSLLHCRELLSFPTCCMNARIMSIKLKQLLVLC